MSRFAKAAVITTAAVGTAFAGGGTANAGARGAAVDSPGLVAGNVVGVPIHIPVNLCGDTVNVLGALNRAAGNTCVNIPGDHHGKGEGLTARATITRATTVTGTAERARR